MIAEAELRQRYEKLGSHAQILLIEKVMKAEFCPGTCIAQTWDVLWKSRCHVNVESIASVKAVKYIYKYVHKGQTPWWSWGLALVHILVDVLDSLDRGNGLHIIWHLYFHRR